MIEIMLLTHATLLTLVLMLVFLLKRKCCKLEAARKEAKGYKLSLDRMIERERSQEIIKKQVLDVIQKTMDD